MKKARAATGVLVANGERNLSFLSFLFCFVVFAFSLAQRPLNVSDDDEDDGGGNDSSMMETGGGQEQDRKPSAKDLS